MNEPTWPEGPTLDHLWEVVFVAETRDEADRQEMRQFAPFEGRTFEWQNDGIIYTFVRCHECRSSECEHIPVKDPYGPSEIDPDQTVTIRFDQITESVIERWDDEGKAAVPQWESTILAPETVTVDGGTAVPIEMLQPWYEPPIIGDRKGFNGDGPFIFPTSDNASDAGITPS